MRVTQYFLEIYNRLIVLFLGWSLNFFVLFYYKEQIVYILGQHQETPFPYFISTSLTEIFFVYFKLSSFLAFYFAYPLVVVQIALFTIPGLYKYEYLIVRNFFLLSIALYIGTTIFTYKVFLPYCWKFFSSFQLKAEESLVSLHLEARIGDYLTFFFETYFLLNAVLHIFLIFLFLLYKITLDYILKYRKLFYLLFFLFATLMTPPDVVSQIVVGIFFLTFFEGFLFSLFLSYEYKKGE
jgi:sec-independent protein translocase protein TatC